MVRQQLAARGIHDRRVLHAMRTVPRHCFAPESDPESCYCDSPVVIGHGQTMSQPYMVALMSELLELRGSERVLEVGSGSGYQTAVLAQLVRKLYTIERVGALLARALAVLQRLGYGNVRARIGDGVVGWRDAGPFERILVAAASPAVPEALRSQLADDGILVMPVGPDGQVQRLVVIHRSGERFTVTTDVACRFVPLVRSVGRDRATPAEA
jgi:protein-L-isoaspartate(D-aspartate) O-methyltransferase